MQNPYTTPPELRPPEPDRKISVKEALQVAGIIAKGLLWVAGIVWAVATFKAQTDLLVTQVKELSRDVKTLEKNVATICGSIKNCKMVTAPRERGE